jgi:D-alanyl-D-alanine carboxypeptidase
MKQQKIIYGLRHFKRREIASLTKMLNLVTILNLIDALRLNPKSIKARASQRASSVIGTTAELRENAIYCL